MALESAGALACTGAGAAGAGAAGAARAVVRVVVVVRAPVARLGVAGSARVARGAGRAGAGATLRCGLRVPDSGVVAITLMSGSVVSARPAAGANSTTATDPSAYARPRRGKRRSPKFQYCTIRPPRIRRLNGYTPRASVTPTAP
jgi:hypothetical protein